MFCFFQNKEIVLSEENIKVIKQSKGVDIPYQVHSFGIYLVIEAKNGLILIWNKKTTLIIKLSSAFKVSRDTGIQVIVEVVASLQINYSILSQGKVCGLCGNFNGNVKDDFTTRNKVVVAKGLDFGNSWKTSTTCPDAKAIKNPCSLYSNRKAWASKHCSIINSEVFAACHSKVRKQLSNNTWHENTNNIIVVR